MPDDDPLPSPLELTPQHRDQPVYLALGLRKEGARESDRAAQAGGHRALCPAGLRFARHHVGFDGVGDAGSRGVAYASAAALGTARGLRCIPLGYIQECRADKVVVLDDRYIPTVINTHQSMRLRLATFMTELQGLMHQRGEALARTRRRLGPRQAPPRSPIS